MRGGIKGDLIIAAAIISLLVHVGGMFWAKPKVMTHIADVAGNAVRRSVMKVTRSAERPDPIAIERLRDEDPRKSAPRVEETMAVLPAAQMAAPKDDARLLSSPQVDVAPPVAEDLKPASVPELLTASIADSGMVAAPKMEMSFNTVEPVLPISTKGLDMPADAAVAPVFEAPVFAPGGSVAEVVREPSVDLPPGAERPEFKPVEEVMPAVDEKVVEAEKAAVRGLLDRGNSLDLVKVTRVSLARCVEGGYTYFRVTVRPNDNLPTVAKDVVVLIDASGSIGKNRLASCRRHAKEILRTAMNTGDRFNLVAFRDKFEYAFKTWRKCDAASYAAGDRWMASLAAHGRTDVFATISSVLTLPREPSRPLIAMVVTDGEANSGVSGTSEILRRFTALNDGLVSVYMYGVKSSGNRELIDVLTRGNRGESFIFDGWSWKAGEGIDAFSVRFRDPLITDLRLAFPAVCAAEAYPASIRNLYRGNSVEIVGRMKGVPAEVVFSLRGIAGEAAYDGFYRLPIGPAKADLGLPDAWRSERRINERLIR